MMNFWWAFWARLIRGVAGISSSHTQRVAYCKLMFLETQSSLYTAYHIYNIQHRNPKMKRTKNSVLICARNAAQIHDRLRQCSSWRTPNRQMRKTLEFGEKNFRAHSPYCETNFDHVHCSIDDLTAALRPFASEVLSVVLPTWRLCAYCGRFSCKQTA